MRHLSHQHCHLDTEDDLLLYLVLLIFIAIALAGQLYDHDVFLPQLLEFFSFLFSCENYGYCFSNLRLGFDKFKSENETHSGNCSQISSS